LQKAAKDSAGVFSDNDNLAQDKLRQLQSELSSAQADRVRRQSQYELASKSAPESLPFFSEGPAREYEVRLTDLMRQLALLSATLTPAHYKIKDRKSRYRKSRWTRSAPRPLAASSTNINRHCEDRAC